MSALLVFFALGFAVTWTCWTGVIAIPLHGVLQTVLILLGVFAPSFEAILVTVFTEGVTGLHKLIGRMFPAAARASPFSRPMAKGFT